MVIVLETNLLRGRIDPRSAKDIEPLLNLAAKVGAAVKIPEPCLIEVRDGCRVEIQNAISDFKRTLGNLHHLRTRGAIPNADLAAELVAYDERLKAFLQAIGVIPFVDPFPDQKTLFEAAVKKQSPFDAKGNNFRDAVICMSVSQFAQTAGTSVLLVTHDGKFGAALTGNERFEVVKLEEAIKRLEGQLSAKDRARRAQLSSEIEAALSKRVAEIAAKARPGIESWLNIRTAVSGQLILLSLGSSGWTFRTFSVQIRALRSLQRSMQWLSVLSGFLLTLHKFHVADTRATLLRCLAGMRGK